MQGQAAELLFLSWSLPLLGVALALVAFALQLRRLSSYGIAVIKPHRRRLRRLVSRARQIGGRPLAIEAAGVAHSDVADLAAYRLKRQERRQATN